MRISDVESIPLEYELPEGRSLGSSRGKTATRFTCLVRLETDEGLVGWGEAFAPPRTVATAIEELLADDVVGMDPHAVESLAEHTYTHGYHFGASAIKQCALSGIDIACWDLLGKDAGESVATLIGGRRREILTPYASTGYVTSWGQDIAEPIERAVGEGFTAAKIKIGRNVEDDVHRVSTARDILGEDAHLMVDYNGNCRPKQVCASVAALREYDLHWIEEPVPSENYAGYERVRYMIEIPIAAGEAHYGRFEFARLARDCVDILQPNLGRVGGFSEARRVADLATTENVAVCPHVWNSGVGLGAAIQFAASLPDYPHSDSPIDPVLLEFDRSENPLRHEVLVEPFDPTGGELIVPDAPGLGIEVDEEAVDSHRID